eukprot:1157484-Pelagomonas_calceolata.AAC.4
MMPLGFYSKVVTYLEVLLGHIYCILMCAPATGQTEARSRLNQGLVCKNWVQPDAAWKLLELGPQSSASARVPNFFSASGQLCLERKEREASQQGPYKRALKPWLEETLPTSTKENPHQGGGGSRVRAPVAVGLERGGAEVPSTTKQEQRGLEGTLRVASTRRQNLPLAVRLKACIY